MKSTNRLLPLLVFVTFIVIGEVWGTGSNAWGSKSHTSGGTGSGSGDPGRPGSSGSSSSTQASGQNQRSGIDRLPSSEATTVHHTPSAPSSGHRSGFLMNADFPPLPQHRTRSGIQTTTASPSTSSTAVPSDPPTTTHSGIQISSASVEKCVDDQSPAENCFDYFTLAVLWSPGYAYKQSLKGHRARELHPGWVIHGLWPSMYSKDAIIPPRCSRRKSGVTYNTHRFHENNLLEKLSSSWFTVLESGLKTNEMWEHEFKKHGDCATRSTAIKDVYGYFSKTYKLFYDLKIGTKLFNAGYRPGTSEKLRTIIEIFGKMVRVDYATDTTKITPDNQNINYLAEVYVCYDLKLEMIDCPNSRRPNSELDKQVIYLDQMPRTSTTLQPPVQQDDSIKNRGTRRGRARRTASNTYSLGINLNSSALTN